jgi:hypothetical protein
MAYRSSSSSSSSSTIDQPKASASRAPAALNEASGSFRTDLPKTPTTTTTTPTTRSAAGSVSSSSSSSAERVGKPNVAVELERRRQRRGELQPTASVGDGARRTIRPAAHALLPQLLVQKSGMQLLPLLLPIPLMPLLPIPLVPLGRPPPPPVAASLSFEPLA